MAVVRPDNAQQARLLRLLRDDGPRSRAELGDAVELSRSRLAVELDRLVALGLVETGGLAASRGGRRSSIVRIARNARFLGIDIGATSIDVAVTDGELRVLSHESEPMDVRQGPEAVIGRALEERVLPLLADGRAKPIIDSVFPLSDAARAHERMDSGEHIGKIVLETYR